MKTKKPAVDAHIRFPLEVWTALRVFAEKHQRSLNGEIIWILREYLEREEKRA